MSDSIIYKLNIEGNLWDRLRHISVLNDEQLEKWAGVQQAVNAADKTMNNMGKSIGSISQRISALKAQREWIPASNREAIRATNHEIEKLENELSKLHSLDGGAIKRWTNELKSAVPALSMIANPVAIVAAGVYKLTQYIGASTQAYMEESIEVAKLSRVMKNTMGAREDEITSIMALTSAQQKLGVIGDETQMAGAQELATYLQKSDSLKKLIPAMNDMLAQQYGINASQEQAQTIAMMLGKVMQGQTGALSRYGYYFTEAQEKVLKYGTEAERAATLAQVVGEAVGGVNEALAATPEGKLKQQANNMGDLQERVGSLMISVQSAFSPLVASIGDAMDSVIGFFERHREQIMSTASGIASFLDGVSGAVRSLFGGVRSFLAWFIDGVRQTSPVFVAVAGAITGAVAAMMLYKTWALAVTVATNLWAWAQKMLNIVMALNPVGIIIASIVALIAIITYVAMTTTGWGKTWSNVMQWMKLGLSLFKDAITWHWLKIKDEFLTGFEVIERGWYKLKSLWDKSAAQEGLERLEQQRNQRANEILALQNKMKSTASEMLQMKVWEVRSNGKTLKNVTKDLGNKLGINTSLIDTVNGGNSGIGVGGAGGQSTNEAIVTGGTRNTTINIRFNDMVGSMHFEGGVTENESELRRRVVEIMASVLGSAETAI